MAEPSHPDPRSIRTLLAVLGWFALAAYLACVGAWVLVGLWPWVVWPEPLAAFGRADESWPLTLFVAAGALAAVSVVIVRPSPSQWILAGGFAATAFLLGFVSYAYCSAGSVPVWSPVVLTIETFIGSIATPFGVVGNGCPPVYPLSLMASRVAGLATIAFVAGGIVAVVFRRGLDQWRAGRARHIVIFAGLNHETVGAVRSVANSLAPQQRLVLLADGSEEALAFGLAREVGAFVVPLSVDDTKQTRAFVERHARSIQGVYLMSEDVARNLRALTAIDRVLASVVAGAEVPGRIVVRIDNPSKADRWRRHNMVSRAGWLLDAVSAMELAARHLVLRLAADGVRTVVMDGDTKFELAMLSEIAFQHRLHALLNDPALPAPSVAMSEPPRVRLGGPHAQSSAEHFRTVLTRLGVGLDQRVLDPDVTNSALDKLSIDVDHDVVVIGEGESSDSDRLATRQPRWRILQWEPSIEGLTPAGRIGGLTLVGPTLQPVPTWGLDIWDLLGRVQHVRYLQEHWGGIPQVGDPTRDEWDVITPFAKTSNYRTFAALMRFARDHGRVWATRLGDDEGAERAHPFDADELEALAIAEHVSWQKYYEEHGWTEGHLLDEAGAPRADHSRRRHPDITPWKTLGEARRQIDRTTVAGALRTLEQLGFVVVDAS